MAYVNFILTIILVIALVYIHKRDRKEEEELHQNIIDAFKILDEKVDCALKETDDLLNKLDK